MTLPRYWSVVWSGSDQGDLQLSRIRLIVTPEVPDAAGKIDGTVGTSCSWCLRKVRLCIGGDTVEVILKT
jgi:hypothetical protein